jgi:hypothetical protein
VDLAAERMVFQASEIVNEALVGFLGRKKG